MITASVMTNPIFTTTWFILLISFVAVNTLMYLTLAISKMLPKVHLGSLRKRRYERSQERSIFPDGSGPLPRTIGGDGLPEPVVSMHSRVKRRMARGRRPRRSPTA